MKTIFKTIGGRKLRTVSNLPFLPFVQSGLAKVTINKIAYLVHSYEYDFDTMIVTITLGEY